jgi:hypothetical protein
MSIEEMINSERVLNDLGIWQKEVIARVMQNFANQESFSFVRFLREESLLDEPYKYYTIEQLYSLYLNNKPA